MTVCASSPKPRTALLKRVLLNRSFHHPTFCMTWAHSCINFLSSLAHNIVCISEANWVCRYNVITTAFPLHLPSPDWTVIRWNESPCCWRDRDNRMIHSLSKEVTASCAFTTGIWDSLGARSEGQQAKRPSWHTKLVVVWIRSKHLATHYPELQLQSLFDKHKWNNAYFRKCINLNL